MREILFRGRRSNNEWFTGDVHFIDHRVEICNGYCCVGVQPDTVGQWTGAYDTNGKRIFEGDIVDVDGVVYACRWDDGNFEFGLVNEKESFGIVYVVPYVEVIGNIYDNPELLEG